MKPLILALVCAAALFSTAALAQGCRGLPPGRAKAACIQSNPIGAARFDRCREQGIQMGLRPGKHGGLKEFILTCMQRGRR
jgi:hypothetical protein